MRLLRGFMRIKSPVLHGVTHGFFTRLGGVSEGVYASRNCGPGSGDDPHAVTENRRRVMEELQAEEAGLFTLSQIHSSKVVCVRVPWSDAARPQADAMVTNVPNHALGILTADCGPVLFADAQARVVGAAHAGWKGALGGVLENTIAAMEQLGATRANIVAVLGPCIGRESYEVGPEFYENFMAVRGDYHAYFSRSHKAGHFYFDLSGFILAQLKESGLNQASSLAMDTYGDAERFFSYRRSTHANEKDYGRQISAIMLRGDNP